MTSGGDNQGCTKLRCVACVVALCLGALALPGVASAHGRAATVALDYRLVLDAGAGRLAGVRASILDGDRSLRLVVERESRVVVLGDLGEPMLRLGNGVWVNRSSVTAQANRLVSPGRSGWQRVAAGSAFTWHEHRLAPPPFDSESYGKVAGWRVPLVVDGGRCRIRGRSRGGCDETPATAPHPNDHRCRRDRRSCGAVGSDRVRAS